jgi:hypothetical protein
LNTRSTPRFNAFMTPIRASIGGHRRGNRDYFLNKPYGAG